MNYWIVPSVKSFKNIKKEHRRDKLIDKIKEMHSVTHEELIGRDRHESVANWRNVVFYAMYRVYGFTSTETAKHFNRNHATVLSGAKRIKGFMDVDKYYKQEVLELIN